MFWEVGRSCFCGSELNKIPGKLGTHLGPWAPWDTPSCCPVPHGLFPRMPAQPPAAHSTALMVSKGQTAWQCDLRAHARYRHRRRWGRSHPEQPLPCSPELCSNLGLQAAVGCQHLGSPASAGHSHHHHPEQHEGVHLSKSHRTQQPAGISAPAG